MSSLAVKPIKTQKNDIKQSPYMEKNIIAKFPSMMLNIGRSGSGKSTVIAHMCNDPNFYGSYFNHILLFSPTGETDDLVKCLKLPQKNIITKPTEEKLNEILNSQKHLIKTKGIKWVGENSKILLIFDDIVSDRRFLESPSMLKLAAMGRHFLVSSVINTQSYTKIPRAVRLQANSIIMFPSNQTEVERLVDDWTPPHKSKKEFRSLVAHATSGKHDFIFIHAASEVKDRFRKCFHTFLEIP